MKKALFSLMLALNTAALGEEAVPQSFKSGDYTYILLDDGTAEIAMWSGKDAFLDIPDNLDGITVTAIGDKAFLLCSSLSSVSIPDSVTSIGNYAFFILSDSDLTLTVGRDSYAARYAEENYIPYIYPDTNDWLNTNPDTNDWLNS